ncbi:unnamed protein product [Diatraea saccharalis]|uniref:Uncharacterized protein n=1 Tax=Diatraea saccharalis TaxID=40085 RepID=A0A9N9WHN2_9NEOP|nr:unnamed protein product [Diatraea saccharalis]
MRYMFFTESSYPASLPQRTVPSVSPESIPAVFPTPLPEIVPIQSPISLPEIVSVPSQTPFPTSIPELAAVPSLTSFPSLVPETVAIPFSTPLSEIAPVPSLTPLQTPLPETVAVPSLTPFPMPIPEIVTLPSLTPYPTHIPESVAVPSLTPFPAPLPEIVPAPTPTSLPVPVPAPLLESIPLSPSPLPGPSPHQSCRPFTPKVPFQHPWDECQVCVCAENVGLQIVTIEINCYTKPDCCIAYAEPNPNPQPYYIGVGPSGQQRLLPNPRGYLTESEGSSLAEADTITSNNKNSNNKSPFSFANSILPVVFLPGVRNYPNFPTALPGKGKLPVLAAAESNSLVSNGYGKRYPGDFLNLLQGQNIPISTGYNILGYGGKHVPSQNNAENQANILNNVGYTTHYPEYYKDLLPRHNSIQIIPETKPNTVANSRYTQPSYTAILPDHNSAQVIADTGTNDVINSGYVQPSYSGYYTGILPGQNSEQVNAEAEAYAAPDSGFTQPSYPGYYTGTLTGQNSETEANSAANSGHMHPSFPGYYTDALFGQNSVQAPNYPIMPPAYYTAGLHPSYPLSTDAWSSVQGNTLPSADAKVYANNFVPENLSTVKHQTVIRPIYSYNGATTLNYIHHLENVAAFGDAHHREDKWVPFTDSSQSSGSSDLRSTESSSVSVSSSYTISSSSSSEASSAETKELRRATETYRTCYACPHDMMKKHSNRGIKWICGAYQRARRTFKSECMMRYRNCQDGTIDVALSNLPTGTTEVDNLLDDKIKNDSIILNSKKVKTRRKNKKKQRSTSSSSDEKGKKSKSGTGESLSLSYDESLSTSTSTEVKKDKKKGKKKYEPVSSIERRGCTQPRGEHFFYDYHAQLTDDDSSSTSGTSSETEDSSSSSF